MTPEVADRHCETCRHWKPGDSRWNCHTPEQRLGECEAISFGSGPFPQPMGSAPLAVAVCESEGIYAELVTDARFGCILHAPKMDQ